MIHKRTMKNRLNFFYLQSRAYIYIILLEAENMCFLIICSNTTMTNFVHLNLLLEILLKNYFLDSRCVFVFTDSKTKVEFKIEIPMIYMKVHNNTLNSNLIFRHYGCQDVIIHHENGADIFVQFEKLIKLKNERFNMRKYIIIQEDESTIFTLQELDYVSNFLVIVPKKCHDDNNNSAISGEWFKNESYDLITHLYEDRSKNRIPKLLDKWFSGSCSFLYGNNLFPDKLTKQNGRQLRVGTFTFEPYSIVGQDSKTNQGTEGSFMFEFLTKHNLTRNVTIIGPDMWGDIFGNWTGIGLLGSLVDDAVDIGYAGMFTWEKYYNFLDYTKPLTRSGVTCLVPIPELESGWLIPFRSFCLDMWVTMIIVIFLKVIVLTLLLQRTDSRSFKIEDSILTIIRFCLVQPLTVKINTRLMKYFVALNLVYIFFLSATYNSRLASIMTVPRYRRAVETVKDLAFSGLRWGAPSDAWIYSLEHAEGENYRIIKNNFIVESEDDLTASSKMYNFGFVLDRLLYGHYAVGPYFKTDVVSGYRLMKEDIYWDYCIFMTRKNSVLLPLLDRLILRAFEAGLGSYWELQAVSQNMDMSVQRRIRYYSYHIQEHDVVKLKLIHVEGAFGILLIGYIISIAVCFLELFTYLRFKNRKSKIFPI